jgi:protein-tyrosine-phosphatase/catechol 2,3-dioxygenase-like lactoylglutathione lyase family enzyme
MKRFHVHVGVADLDASVAFYSGLFGAAPSVTKPDYAKWMLDDPRINFAISQKCGATKGVEHLGVQVEDAAELAEVYGRLQAANAPVMEEGATTCCYAQSEKSWIADPDGVVWEAFLTVGDQHGLWQKSGFCRARFWQCRRDCLLRPADRGTRPLFPCVLLLLRPAMTDRPINVLFLCTGNSARSILAEAVLAKDGAGRFNAFSAGSQPKDEPHPMALEVLRSFGFPHQGFRSKSWDEFAAPGAPVIDIIITVCDSAAGETCPIWPGHPMTAHWGIADPAAVDGPGQRDAFLQALRYMRRRIELLLALPYSALDEMTLTAKLRTIGAEEGATAKAIEQ